MKGDWSMRKRIFKVIIVALVSIAFSPAILRGQGAGDEESIKNVVGQVLTAFAKKDLNGIMAYWSEKSPQLAGFKQYAQTNFATSDSIQFENITFTRRSIEANQATVRVRFEKKWLDLRAKQPAQQVIVWEVQLVKEAEGWKWWQRRDMVNDLAQKLDAAKTKEERSKLLQDEKELVTAELVSMLNNAGDGQSRQGKLTAALRLNDLALEVAEGLGDQAAIARCYGLRGYMFYRQSMFKEALENYQHALPLFRGAKNKRAEASTLNNIGNVYRAIGKFEGALAQYGAALELARETGDRATEADLLNNIGNTYRSTGKYKEALAQYDASLKIDRTLGNRTREAETLGNVGITYRLTGRYEEALAQYEAALKVLREAGDRAGEAKTLGNLGNIYGSTGRYEEALVKYEASLKIMQELGNKDGESSALGNTGIIYLMTGRSKEALAQFEASLKIDQMTGNQAGEAATRGNMGNTYNSIGRYGDGLAQFEASFKIMQDIGDQAGAARSLVGMGNIYWATGKYEEALEKLEASLQIVRAIGDKPTELEALSGIGIIYESSNQYEKALAQHQAALKIARDIGDPSGEAEALSRIGNVYGLMGKYAEALAQYEAGLKIMQEIGDKSVEAIVLYNIGNVYRLTGKYDEALAQYGKGVKAAESVGDLDTAFKLYWHTGVIYRARKQWQQAIDAYRKSIQRIELTRSQTQEHFLQISFFRQYTAPYYGLAECLLELGSGDNEAFAASERAKARTLVDLMAGGKISLLEVVSDQDRQRERELNAKLIAATAQFNNAQSRPEPDQRQIGTLEQQLNQARGQYDEFRRTLFLRYPELRTKRAEFEPVTLTQLNQTLFAREPNLCVLSYLISEDKTLLFVITAGKNVNSPANLAIYTLKTDDGRELAREELNRKLEEYRRLISRDAGIYKPMGRELYRILLGPAEKELIGKRQVVIVPDGLLNTLPFQTLLDKQDRHFIEKHTTSYAPSVTALVEMTKLADQRKGKNISLLPMFAMGRRTFEDYPKYRNSELQRAEEQVIAIAKLFGVKPFIQAEATETMAKSEMGKARYVHLATHGYLNGLAPMYSALMLARSADDDGLLYARELMDMQLQAEMVVLSACDTGLGQPMSGEGLLGLTWSLFVAGTPSSVVTQWSVREDSMNILMMEFYKQLRSKGSNGQLSISKAEALRKAQLSLMKKADYTHPYHWAPAVLVGDWR
jgi:CHAT domain-containing protein/Flp pilus assembly protein TadD